MQKNDNYFRNNDPLIEDSFILRREDSSNMMSKDSKNQKE